MDMDIYIIKNFYYIMDILKITNIMVLEHIFLIVVISIKVNFKMMPIRLTILMKTLKSIMKKKIRILLIKGKLY